MAKTKRTQQTIDQPPSTFVRRRYGVRQGRNVFTWAVVRGGEVIARSARTYGSDRAMVEDIRAASKLLAMV